MKLKIEINLDNAAFHYPYIENEAVRILNDLSERIGYLTESDPLIIRDINGNNVGEVQIIKE